MNAKESLMQEMITLPQEILDRGVKKVQISFLFEDGSMHHVKPPNENASQYLAADCLKRSPIQYDSWEFLTEKETEL